MQAFIATIRTAIATSTELLIAYTERDALEDAEKRHGADSQHVLIAIERADFGPVIIVNGVTRNHEMTMLAKIDEENAKRYATKRTTSINPTRVQVPFATFGHTEPVLREVELIASYADGYSRIRKADGNTATVHTSTIRPLGAAVIATLDSIRLQLIEARADLLAA
jgi:hypothetical protein